jgi:hypothetical protein
MYKVVETNMHEQCQYLASQCTVRQAEVFGPLIEHTQDEVRRRFPCYAQERIGPNTLVLHAAKAVRERGVMSVPIVAVALTGRMPMLLRQPQNLLSSVETLATYDWNIEDDVRRMEQALFELLERHHPPSNNVLVAADIFTLAADGHK